MRLTTILCACILAGTLGGVAAEEPRSSFESAVDPGEPTTTTIFGTVVSTSGYNLALETRAGNRADFELGSDSVLPTGLETGAQIAVRYRPSATGVSHVVEVTRLDATPPQSAPTPLNAEELAANSTVVPGGSPATPSEAARRAAARPRSKVVKEAPRTRPTRDQASNTTFSRPALAFAGVAVLGVVVATGLFLRNRA